MTEEQRFEEWFTRYSHPLRYQDRSAASIAWSAAAELTRREITRDVLAALYAEIDLLTNAAEAAAACLDGVARGDYDGNAAEMVAALRGAIRGRPETQPGATAFDGADAWNAYGA